MALTVNKVAKLTEPGRYGDGRGLYLQVTPTGSRSWLLRYELADARAGRVGKRRERWMGLGPVDDFTLDEARQRARKARQLLKDKIDPLDARKAERIKQATDAAAAAAKDKTFEECAELFYKFHSPKWKNAKYRNQFSSALKRYAFPVMGRASRWLPSTGRWCCASCNPSGKKRIKPRTASVAGLNPFSTLRR